MNRILTKIMKFNNIYKVKKIRNKVEIKSKKNRRNKTKNKKNCWKKFKIQIYMKHILEWIRISRVTKN